MFNRSKRSLFALAAAFSLGSTQLAAQAATSTAEDILGHAVGADYVLPDYTAFTRFVRQLESESPRVKVVEIGTTAEGRTQLMTIVTSPENHARLEQYRGIAERLARAEDLTEEEARELAREGKAVVWIDGGLHATEVLGASQLMETILQLASRTDAETMRILDDVIVLAVHANPDGMDLVAGWYMRHEDPMKRSTSGIPFLYQKYIGHDNNRDFYASTQPETENMNRQLYHVWFPQVMYNHHQTGPVGTVMFAPPFRDPFNYNFDPIIVTQLDLVGAAMHNRFEAEGMPGVTMRRGANYSTWWNGGLRTTAYFHNIVGLLTETIGNPTPMEIPFIPDQQLPKADLPMPIAPQPWHFRQSVDYSVTANYAVLDVASRYRETFLLNMYRMARNSIERGSRDHWTIMPSEIDSIRIVMERETSGSYMAAAGSAPAPRRRNVPDADASQRYYGMLRSAEKRDPRAFVLSADQEDLPNVIDFVNALRENNITVHRAATPITLAGRSYPAGSFVVRTAQAFRPHIMDMFEPQDHPHDFAYPGGPPIPPYDAAGWTLAYQMGVEFDRILDGAEDLEGRLEEVTEWNITPPAGKVSTLEGAAGYLLSPGYVHALGAVTALLTEGEEVYRLSAPLAGDDREYAAGSYFVRAGSGTRERLARVAAEKGVSFGATATAPTGTHERLSVPRIALWDRYGGSMPSGWTRWILEQHGIPYEVVYPPRLDAGDLRKDYDVIVFVDGGVPAPATDAAQGGFGGFGGSPDAADIPTEYHHMLGSVTPEKTVPALEAFMSQGGTVLTIGSSAALAKHLGLPVEIDLLDDDGVALANEEFYIPGSVLSARVNAADPLAAGVGEEVNVFFDDSPVFTLTEGAAERGIRTIAWYDSASPLRSGWAWGQDKLEGRGAIVAAPVGEGELVMFGPEVLYRAQPRGTFKFFFNALASSGAEVAEIR